MTDLATLREILHDGDWFLEQEQEIFERDLGIDLFKRSKFNIVEVATGVRRSGKSTILLWIGRLLKKQNKKVYYLNFEDDRFFPEGKDLQKITSLIDQKNAVMLIDEPQNMPKWERWVRRMNDRKVKIYLTGSNSKLLGTELSSAIGGRKKQHEVFPFSFTEFLNAKGETSLPSDQKVRLFEKYMTNGGFPYPVISGDHSIFTDYRNDIMERDIILRHEIRNVSAFRDLTRFVMANPGLYLSERSIRGFIDISHVTLRKYLDYLIEAYAVIPLEKFSYSQKEQMLNPKKIYPIDNGLLIKKNDNGKLIEACIVQHLRRYIQDLYYWKDERGREVDIYIPDLKLAIQVVYELNTENLKREQRALESAVKKFQADPLIVCLYSDVESKYPIIKAPEFLDKLDSGLKGLKMDY